MSDLQIEKISRSLILEWERLPPYLGLRSIAAEDIENDCSITEPKNKRLKFLNEWKTIKGADATYEVLVCALLQIERQADAQSVCELLQDNPDSGMVHIKSRMTFLTWVCVAMEGSCVRLPRPIALSQ